MLCYLFLALCPAAAATAAASSVLLLLLLLLPHEAPGYTSLSRCFLTPYPSSNSTIDDLHSGVGASRLPASRYILSGSPNHVQPLF